MSKLQTFASIMLFYAILSFILGPILFYYLGNKNLENAGYGFVFFSIVSIGLWFKFGKSMVLANK